MSSNDKNKKNLASEELVKVTGGNKIPKPSGKLFPEAMLMYGLPGPEIKIPNLPEKSPKESEKTEKNENIDSLAPGTSDEFNK